VQDIEYEYVPACPIGPTVVPALVVAIGPAHPSEPVPPLATQPVVPTVDHESTVDSPVIMWFGLAASVVIAGGVGAGVTVTVVDAWLLVPPGPVHDSE